MVETKNNNVVAVAPVSNDLNMDAASRADKQRILKEQHVNARLGSTAETFQFMAAILLPVGLTSLISTATAGGNALTFGSVISALATAATPAVLLGVAALCTAVAIGSRYMASKHYHNANLNTSEMNAQHSAKYIAKELKAQAACVQSECPENVRADGKKWTQVVQEQNRVLSLTR